MVRTAKTPVKKSAPKVAPVETRVSEPVPETQVKEEVVPTPATANSTDLVDQRMREFGEKLTKLLGLFSNIKKDFKTLEKSVSREMRTVKKAAAKKRKNQQNREASGFTKPTPISNELATFLNLDHGSWMARTDVSKEISEYIRKHNLQDKNDGRIIIADDKLRKLLNIDKKTKLTYFNLQTYIKHHFSKPAPGEVAPNSK